MPDEKAKWLISKIERLALVDERLNNFIESNTKGDKTKWDQAIYEGSLSPEGEEHKPEEETIFYALLDASNAIQKKVLNKHVMDIWNDIRAEFSKEEINNLINWYKCDMQDLIKIFPDLDMEPRATLIP